MVWFNNSNLTFLQRVILFLVKSPLTRSLKSETSLWSLLVTASTHRSQELFLPISPMNKKRQPVNRFTKFSKTVPKQDSLIPFPAFFFYPITTQKIVNISQNFNSFRKKRQEANRPKRFKFKQEKPTKQITALNDKALKPTNEHD